MPTNSEVRTQMPSIGRPRRKDPTLDEYFLDGAFDEMFDDRRGAPALRVAC